ncbi:hypothetical protein KM043_005172 [Ampulex compressa]|nr:hypothetical protein KM043_005172 [Ampulex compressa]
MGASWCKGLKGRRRGPFTLAELPGKGASALLSYAPRWLQTTELNQLKFNPEPRSREATPSSTFPTLAFPSRLSCPLDGGLQLFQEIRGGRLGRGKSGRRFEEMRGGATTESLSARKDSVQRVCLISSFAPRGDLT